MKVIPAIDVLNGKCVRLTQGDYNRVIEYESDPVVMAKKIESWGCHFLHLVDLDGARQKHIVNWKVLNDIKVQTGLEVDFGGGLKTSRDLQIAFDCGADKVNIGSASVQSPVDFLKWLQLYGAEKIILSADVRDGYIAVSGWLEETPYKTENFIAHFAQAGIKQVACTLIESDGMLEGVDVDFYRKLVLEFPGIAFTASGGISSLEELTQLEKAGVQGAIVGKALYEGVLKPNEIWN